MAGSIEDKLALLKQRYTSTFPTKLAELEEAKALLDNGDRQGGLEKLRHHAHKLAGSGASYGFLDLSAQARKLERASLDSQGNDDSLNESLFIEYNNLLLLLNVK